MMIDWTTATGWAALITAAAAVIALIIQSRQTRFSVSLDMLLRLEQQFRGDDIMLRRRKRAADALIRNEQNTDLDEVINFFELLGFLLRRKAIDAEMVWYSFYSRATGYWFASQEYIQSVRVDDSTIWMDFEYLIKAITKIESKKNRSSIEAQQLTENQIEIFLKEECDATGCNSAQPAG